MRTDEIRFLYAYDRWASAGAECARRPRTGGVDANGRRRRRGLGAILVHHLGRVAALAPRIPGHRRVPEPELDLLPTIDQLREGWELEWAAVDAWLPTVTDGFVGYVHLGVPVWQMLVHVVNHGTSSRSGGPSPPRADRPASST